jgi:hypothetical protein
MLGGGGGSILAMIQSLKSNRTLVKKHKSLKEINKAYSKPSASEVFNEAAYTKIIETNKARSRKNKTANRINNYLSLTLVLVIFCLFFYFLIIRKP